MTAKFFRSLMPYGIALITTGVATLLTLWLEPWINRTMGAFFYVAVIISSWYGGLRPGLVCIVIAVAALNYYLIPPIKQFWGASTDDLIRLGIFSSVSLVISVLTSNLRDNKYKVEALSRRLQAESADRLQVALTAAQMGMWDWDLTTGEIRWLPEHERLFGMVVGQFDGRYETFEHYIHPDDRAGLSQAVSHALQNRVAYHHEFRVVWVDGSVHWIEGNGRAFYNDQNEPVRMTGTIMAIDQRKQTEAMLQEQEAILRLFAQSAPASVAMFDTRMRYMMASQRWIEEYCLDPLVTLIGQSHYDIFPEVPEQWRQVHQRCLAGAVEKCDEDLFLRADGTQQWVSWEVRPWYNASGTIGGIVIFSVDVTARKQAEETLRQSETRLRMAQIASNSGVWDWDIQTNTLIWSSEYYQLYGLDPTVEPNYETWLNSIHPDDRERTNQTTLNVLNNPNLDLRVEFRIVRAGEVRWLAGIGQVLRDPAGEPLRMIGITIDITNQKQTELALQQLNAELEERIAERTAELQQANDRLLETLIEQQHTQLLLFEQAQLLDLAHDTIMTCDLNAVITFWNQGAEAMYGWRRAEALGQEVHTLLQTQYPQPLAEIQALLFEQGYWEGELVHVDRAGRSLMVASRWVLQKDEMGRPLKILEINNDITVQKQVEQELQQSAHEIEDLYNNAPCGYHSLDGNGVVIRMNQTELNWLGYTSEEVINQKSFADLITLESRAVFEVIFPQFRQPSWIENLELQMLHKDGTTRWVSLNSTAVYDESGNFVRTRSTVFDITDRRRAETERQQAENALRDSEERLRLSLDLTHIGSWDWSLATGDLIWNNNHFTLLGLNPEKTTPSYELWCSRVHPDDLAWVEQQFADSMQHQADYAVEYRVVYLDGSVHWLMARAKALMDATGQPLRSVGVLLDVTARKQIEESLRQSEETFRSLSEFSPTGIFLCDAAGDCIYTNPRFEQIVGCTAEQARTNGWLGLVHPEDRAWIMAEWQDIVRLGREGNVRDLRYLNAQGRICYTHVRIAPVKTTEGQVIRFVGVVEDVTAQREVDRMKQEFISVVSHELRTPLTSIRGALGLVAGGIYDQKPEKKQEMIQIAARQSDRLVRLVNDILDLRRLESGQTRFEFKSCAALDLIQQSVDVMRSQADQSQIHLTIVPSTAMVWADADAIVQTLTNLLSNAIKFSPPHSTITITATAPDSDGCTRFSVQDQGRGIPADQLNRIFGQFQQVDASDSREKGGTGLGLAICTTIVEQHGGRIWVESSLGEGSIFYFTVPAFRPDWKNS